MTEKLYNVAISEKVARSIFIILTTAIGKKAGFDMPSYPDDIHKNVEAWLDPICFSIANDLPQSDNTNMTFNEYQEAAHRTSFNTEIGGDTLLYPVLGLLGEAGEIANKVKKIYRDKGGNFDENDRIMLLDESSDLTWYLAEICTQLGVSLEDVAKHNITKLADRAARGVIGGNGDNR